EVFESLLPAAQNGQDAQELHVQPHQRQSDAEGGGPGVLARYTITHAAADLVEVHDQAHRGQEHRDRTDHHTDRQAEDLDAAHAEGTTDVGEPHDSEVDQAEQAVADQPDHHDLLELGGDAHLAGLEQRQVDTEGDEGGQHCLDDDAGPHGLEDPGDHAQEHALERAVDDDQRGAGLLLEDVHEPEHETAQCADHHRRDHHGRRHQEPRPHGGHDHHGEHA